MPDHMPAHRHSFARALVFAAALAFSALAQAQEPAAPRAVDSTGTGGGPASTITAHNTNALGVTKPPGGAGVAANGNKSAEMLAERDKREKAKNDRISNSICRGC